MKTLTTVRVELAERSYEIRIGSGWISDLGSTLSEIVPGSRFALITNPDIGGRWAETVLAAIRAGGLEADLFEIPEGESEKNLDTVSRIYDFLLEKKYERSSTVAALGGGVVGDIAGFAAATFLRGVNFVQLPTSLLAMVDSSVGGKTGVDHPRGKNLIGAFKQPVFVGIDLDFLGTLPDAELKAGLAEVVKYGMIYDAAFFEYLEDNVDAILAKDVGALTHVITRSCEIKAAVVAEDEREHGLRAILNYGHTFAHACEALEDFKGLRHGEAVAAGMMAAARLSHRIGNTPEDLTPRLSAILGRFELPARLPRFEPEQYLAAMRSDKKVRRGRLRFVVSEALGKVKIQDDIDESVVREVLEASF